MEISYYDATPLISSETAIALIIAFLIIIECAKEPEYRCENCDKVYKQEARYKAHIAGCIVVGDTILGAVGAPLVRIVVGDTILGAVGAPLVRIVGDTILGVTKVPVAAVAPGTVSAEDFSELLRQNREMMAMMRSQQETIQLLVDRLTAQAPK
jgi:hypothetical protein